MKKDIRTLVRPNISNLVPYSSARDEYTGTGAVYMDANENPFNAPYNRYPDPHQSALKQKIAGLKGVSPRQLFVGNGSDEAIDLLYRIFCVPGKDNVVSIDPTYGMYQVCADIHDVEVRRVPLGPGFQPDLSALKSACDDRTRLLFICTPNNPTANSFEPSDILHLAEALDVIVVVDEAYIDFSTRESLKAQTSLLSNLVVLQTFSKAWALAGIRLGIAIADPQVIGWMDKVKYPYNINVLTQNFAMKALDKAEEVEQWVRTILTERKRLEKRLKVFRFVEKIYPSDANFLLVKVSKPKKLYHFLVEKKIIVRDRSDIALIGGSLRITVGSPEENAQLLDALMRYQRDFVDSCPV